jgi:hypothetical protein
MKCIQAIRETKYAKVGDIKRVSDAEANEKVDTKYWKFVPKSEWKGTRKISTDQMLKEHAVSEETKSKKK